MKPVFAGFLSVAVRALLVFGLTSTAQANNWHDTEHPPVTSGNLWSDDANWTAPGTPTAGMSFRIEQYAADSNLTGTVIMDVDYSAGALGTAQFFGCETVSMQTYFKAAVIWLNNGGNAPNGAHILVETNGTIWGDVKCGSEGGRKPPVIDFVGGDWVAGNLTTGTGNRQGGIIRVSTNSGALTPGNVNVSLAPEPVLGNIPGFEFVLVAAGVAPITLTDADPLQFTGAAAGTNPFKLSVDMSAYAGPAVLIPLFIFSGSSTETDRMFAPLNITISSEPGTGSPWSVEQTDSGVTLTPTGGASTIPGMLLYVK